jgi:AcrR family transcriptional regulator
LAPTSSNALPRSADPLPEAATAPERSREATRQRLVVAGTELFASQGLHATTSVQVARRAGVAAGTFYLHFKDKHVLFREISYAAFASLRERLANASARGGNDPLAVVRARVEELLDFAEENRSLVQLLFGREHSADTLSEEIFDGIVPGIEAGLRKRIAAGQAAPLDPAVTAQALAAMWTRVATWWVEDPTRAPREAVVETLVQLHPFANVALSGANIP